MTTRKRANDSTLPKKAAKSPVKIYVEKADEGAVVRQWCSKWEHWECGGLSNNEYDMLSNSSDKIMFFAHNAT